MADVGRRLHGRAPAWVEAKKKQPGGAGLLALATARDGQGSNANKAASLPEAALQSVLVAGARFGHWLQLGRARNLRL